VNNDVGIELEPSRGPAAAFGDALSIELDHHLAVQRADVSGIRAKKRAIQALTARECR
jgi:hypothetical protein